jgi:hypothetical protein
MLKEEVSLSRGKKNATMQHSFPEQKMRAFNADTFACNTPQPSQRHNPFFDRSAGIPHMSLRV